MNKPVELGCTSKLPKIPVGCYNSDSSNLCLTNSLAITDTDTSLPKATNPLASYLLRMDILDDKGDMLDHNG